MTPRVLQGVMRPDPALPQDPAVLARLSGGATWDGTTWDGAALRLPPGARAGFDTWANLFNAGLWAAHGPLAGLALRLSGTGTVTLHVRHATGTATGRTLVRTDVALTAAGTAVPLDATDGLLLWSLETRDGAVLLEAAFTADPLPRAPVRLALVVTTFRREAAVRATAARIAAVLDADDAVSGSGAGAGSGTGSGALAGAHLFVVDNGQSVALPAHPRLTLIPNRNLGGAGGFARGLAAARDAGGFSHVLFMDDDAACPMTNLTRTAAFLHHATDPATALAGAMVSARRPWHLWENGAVFDRLPRSRFSGTDLRDAGAVVAMELATPAPPPEGSYGAWWYFAFPLAAVTHDPYPFFVRGDDVWFGLSNRFRIATLNGVMSLQDDFAAKASPVSLYLDLRFLMVVNMIRPGRAMGLAGCLALAWRQVLHSISRMHYDTAAAQLLALADLLGGPAHFVTHITMADRRARIAALTGAERWGPCPAVLPPAWDDPAIGRGRARAMRATLNGHLLPGFARRGRAVTVPLADRGGLAATRGAARAVFLDDGDGGDVRAYEVTHDKARALRLVLRGLWLSLRWVLAWPRLRRAFRASRTALTRPAFWAAQFDAFPD